MLIVGMARTDNQLSQEEMKRAARYANFCVIDADNPSLETLTLEMGKRVDGIWEEGGIIDRIDFSLILIRTDGYTDISDSLVFVTSVFGKESRIEEVAKALFESWNTAKNIFGVAFATKSEYLDVTKTLFIDCDEWESHEG